MVHIALLGPPGVLHGGQPAKVAGRQQALLAALALRARTTAPTDLLVDVVCGRGAAAGRPGQRLAAALEGTHAVLTLAWAGVERAQVLALAGAHDEAAASAAAALGIARQVGDPSALAVALEGLAAAHAEEDPERAVTLLATGAAIRAASATPVPPPEQRDIDRIAGRARAHVGQPAYDARWRTAYARASAEPDELLAELAGEDG